MLSRAMLLGVLMVLISVLGCTPAAQPPKSTSPAPTDPGTQLPPAGRSDPGQ